MLCIQATGTTSLANFKLLSIEITATESEGNVGHGLGQTHKCGRVKSG